jgi:multisubunit Na+/H+ antiporter MnhB subunit
LTRDAVLNNEIWETLMVDERQVQSARRRVAEIEGFYVHLSVYVGVLVLLTALNATTVGDQWWVHWVWLGWGIGVLAHAFAVFAEKPQFIVNWERRKFREIVRR